MGFLGVYRIASYFDYVQQPMKITQAQRFNSTI